MTGNGGKFTYVGARGSTITDYIIVNKFSLEIVLKNLELESE